MVTLRSNSPKRTIAVLMAMILLLGMLPVPGVTAATGNHPDAVTISVKDSDGTAVSGASVHYVITGETVETIDNTKTTDEFGTVEVLASEKFVEDTYKISATISCDTYVTATLSERSISSADQDFVITMEKEEVKPDPKPITGITVTKTEEKYTGAEFPAVKITGTQTGDVVTVTVNKNATVLNANASNMPKIKEVGSYEVKVDVTREGYADFTQTVTSVISKNTLDIMYEGITKEYDEGNAYAAIELVPGSTLPAVDSITYQLNGGEPSNEIPKISDVGLYTIHVHATKAGYKDFDQVYKSEITLGTIDDSNVKIAPVPNLVYNEEDQQLITITGTDIGKFTYTLRIEGEKDKYSDPTKLKKCNAGEYKVIVTLSRKNYKDIDVPVTAIIKKADQTLVFTAGYENPGETSDEFDADKSYCFAAEITSELKSDGAITYSIKAANAESGEASAFATIGKDGWLTFTAAGAVTVTATLAESTNYNSATITHNMSISRTKGLIKFVGDAEEKYVFGTKEGQVSTKQFELSDPRDKGVLSFEFENSDDVKNFGLELQSDLEGRSVSVTISDYSKLNSALDKSDQKTISVVVKAEKAAVCDKEGRVLFGSASASYTITITYETLPDQTPCYTLKAGAAVLEGPNGKNDWYCTEVVVLPAEADRYTLACTIDMEAKNFEDEVKISDQGDEKKYIYLRNTETGGICSKVLLEGLKIDSVKPTECTVEYREPSVGDTIRSALSLGFYQSSVKVTFTANDATSGVQYFKWWYVREEGANENNAPSMNETQTVLATPIPEDVKDEEIHTVIKGYTATITLTTEEYNQMRGKIFAVAVDAAGHESDESNDNNGFVLDDISPTMTLEYTEANRTVGDRKYYNDQIDFTLRITENNFFSEDVNVTVNGVETSVTWSENNLPSKPSNLYTGKFTIGTEKGGDYTIKIDYEDRSTNPMKPEKTYTVPYTLVIDTTKPVITPTYQNASIVGTDRYYNNSATLALTFTEANFFQEDVQIVITPEGGGTSQATVAWDSNSVDGKHIATVTFPAPAGGGADGHYTVTANYTDPSGNRMTTFASDRITIDTIAPTISVSYDNNDLTNENYFTETENAKFFKAGREATITIVEHNFDSNKVTISAVAAGHGAETPAISGWTNSGDTHTAKVTFSVDGDYTFDVSAIDVAENKSGDVEYGNSDAPKEFTIDTNPDMIVIAPDSVVEGKAYTYDDVIIPDITISDDNLEGYEITLKGVQRGNEIDLTEQVNDLVKNEDNLATALLDVFSKKAELDGIYTLTVRSTDLSDNTDEKVIRFTVNRFGSVYEYSDSLMDLIKNGGTYNRSLDEDLTFTIYNASPIDPNNVSVVITRDGRPVEAIFTVVETTADGDGWYSYLVTIDKSSFAEDGVYTVSVTTTDDADNTVENTVDNSDGDILFYVDSTAPQLTSVSGLEERIVNATELEVSYTVYDTIGLASVQVKVDGEIVDTATDFEDASNYSGKFTINEKSSEQHVSFVLTDKAGNVTESDAEGFKVPYTLEKDVTVSTNLFVRWFANKPLFFGGIGGGVAILGGLGALLGLKKKKKVKVS